MIVALSAVVLGLCALVVSVVQVRMMHEQQHASAWPRLVVMPSATGDGIFISVRNPGIGPALIQHVKVLVDDSATTTWEGTLAELLPGRAPTEFVWSTIGDRIIPPGEEVRVLSIASAETASMILAEAERVAIEICYCSVYDRCWKLETRFTQRVAPQEVRSCPRPGSDAFMQ